MKYDKYGNLKSNVTLQGPSYFAPYHVVVFDSGDFLLTGDPGTKPPNAKWKPFTAIYKSDGKLAKQLFPAEDSNLDRAADSDHDMMTVAAGAAVLGSDGNAYVMRRTLPAVIYAISPTGDVLRTLRVDSDGTGLYPFRLAAGEGSLAILFENYRHMGPKLLKTVDLEGNTRNAFSVLFPDLICFQQSQFTFLGAEAGIWHFSRWEPRK